ncbi:tetratricopeptide repeat protein [Acinetobacter sp. P1(2025)]|uniref:tetratricopeptide repeat protein n=1 Tax=Acinetobacter sp. P1(2025) TaxID=3446120 RepID=UPI003F5328C4
MLQIKKGIVASFVLMAGSLIHGGITYAAPIEPNSNKLLERPSWLPELPTMDNSKFAPDSVIYTKLRKRLLEDHDKTALPELEKLVKRGHAASLVLSGYILDQEPKLIKTDSTKAGQYWQRAAQANDAAAIYNLGILYLNGRGVPQNLDTADKLFALAAGQGMYRAYYMRGQLMEKNVQYPQAIQQYTRCLNVNYLVQCKTRFGILNVTKIRLKPEEAKRVINILTIASKQGDLEASYTLARLAAEGIVLSKSLATMVYYLEVMLNSKNTTNQYRQLAIKMYKAYNPTQDDIKRGKDNYRIANAGNVSSLVYRKIDTTKPVLDAGNIIE